MNDADRALTPEQAACLPTEADVAFYEQHGWYVSKPVLPAELLDEAADAAQRFYQGQRDMPLPIRAGFTDWRPEHGETIRNNEFVSLQSHALARLVRYPVVGAIAARLARTPSIRLLDDQLVYKPPGDRDGSTTVGWHADHAYWGTCSSDAMLTAWIPFHDVDETRGPLAMIDGSHRWPDLKHARHFNDRNLGDIEDRLRRRGHEPVKIPIVLEKGQVSFHHCWTLHGSYPNRSDKPRLALAVHLQDEANSYRPYSGPDGREIHIADELLCRRTPEGEPDFRDPTVFPVLWPA
jgi:ectoine hydroxylase-related dioxygenase (phytanoyl-CoA dioxygenase family)